MNRHLIIIIVFSSFIHYSYSQNFTGTYNDDYEFLSFEKDSIVEFALFIENGWGFNFLEKGKGKWNKVGKYLIINIIKSPSNNVIKESKDFSDSIRVFDLEGKELVFANCTFYNKQDSLFNGATSDFDGWISLDDPRIDSVEISTTGFGPAGFKPQKGIGYRVYLGDYDFIINKGQIILKITNYTPESLTFKFVDFSTRNYELSFHHLTKVKIKAFLTHQWTELKRNKN